MAALLVVAIAAPAGAREKVDVVRFDNGDVLTGEVKELDLGVLTLSTTGKGTVSIEWIHVASLVSPQIFEVELSSGEKLYGFLEEPEQPGSLKVSGRMMSGIMPSGIPIIHTVPLDQVVRIAPIEQTLLKRLHGSLDLGFSYAKANKATTFNFSSELRSRRPRYDWRISGSANRSARSDAPTTSRADGSFTLDYFLGDRWFVPYFWTVQQNEELDLQMRTTVGAGIGRYLVQTNRTVLSASLKGDTNRERYFSTEEGKYNAEAVLGVNFQYFTFSGRKTNVSTSLELIPSLTESGRYRVEYNGSFRHELFKDFYVSLQLYYSWDSKPPTDIASATDWGSVTAVGWSF